MNVQTDTLTDQSNTLRDSFNNQRSQTQTLIEQTKVINQSKILDKSYKDQHLLTIIGLQPIFNWDPNHCRHNDIEAYFSFTNIGDHIFGMTIETVPPIGKINIDESDKRVDEKGIFHFYGLNGGALPNVFEFIVSYRIKLGNQMQKKFRTEHGKRRPQDMGTFLEDGTQIMG